MLFLLQLRAMKCIMDPILELQFSCINCSDVFLVLKMIDTLYFVLQATFDCLMKTYGFLTPEFWKETRFTKSPFQEYTDLLAKPTGKALILEEERVEAWFTSFWFYACFRNYYLYMLLLLALLLVFEGRHVTLCILIISMF